MLEIENQAFTYSPKVLMNFFKADLTESLKKTTSERPQRESCVLPYRPLSHFRLHLDANPPTLKSTRKKSNAC